jgi:hypothetical protein
MFRRAGKQLSAFDIPMQPGERYGGGWEHAKKILAQKGASQFSTIAQISGIDINTV